MEDNIIKQSKNQPVVKVGISHGDLNGISYEIIIKSLRDKAITDIFMPVIFGSSKIASYYRKALRINDFTLNLVKRPDLANPKRANIVNITENDVRVDVGKSTKIAGELALLSLNKTIESIKANTIDVLVTAPINKQNIQSEEFDFPGHTEFLASRFDANPEDVLMLMVYNNLRVGVVTGHIPILDVPKKITTDLICKKAEVMVKSLNYDFGIRRPRIAILGLNPHASDDGLIGKEENDVIIPAIEKLKEKGILAFGPFSADGFFSSDDYKHFDAVLAMYHDQGLMPFKIISSGEGVNFTAGLSIVRTSPGHGTAYGIAGKNKASEIAMRNACYLAVDIYRNRQQEDILNKDPLVIVERQNDTRPRRGEIVE